MSGFARAIATVGDLGCARRAPGTLGSAVGWLLGLWLVRLSPEAGWLLLGAASLVAIRASTLTERAGKMHDPGYIIIDEVIGMAAVLVAIPAVAAAWWQGLLAFGLFRLFDVLKPPPLRWLATFPAGWGILLDDLGASAYTVLMLTVARTFVG